MSGARADGAGAAAAERPDVPWQQAALDIWDRKYRLRARDGAPLDKTPDDTFARVARALADVEATPALRERWYPAFLRALREGALPAGRILSNAGAGAVKPRTSLINCTVSGTVGDSMDDILRKVHEAGLTLKAGCGIGYEFSTLRPRGAFVSGAGAFTSGPLPFMDIFDRMCFAVMSAGGRRGAQMATFDVAHPDVAEFVAAKREDGRLRQFNLSLLLSRDFMEAVAADDPWRLVFPLTPAEAHQEKLDLNDSGAVVWRDWPTTEPYVVNEAGEVACRVFRTVRARELWDLVMRAAYDYGEPGFVLVDAYNELNNNWFCEHIRATNPCGEQGLPPYGSCLLGSVNLTGFVRAPFTTNPAFDWDAYREVVAVFTRMLDNVVELNGLALERQRDAIFSTRRHGMGFLGLGSALAMMGIEYGTAQAVAFTERVARELALTGWRTALELAREKGPAPLLSRDFEVTAEMLRLRPEMRDDGYAVGDTVPGRVLHARYSRYMQRIAAEEPELVDALADTGARFTHHSSVAPTGTIALSFGNNASNGIEPSFAHSYTRNVIAEGRKAKQNVTVESYELLAWRAAQGDDADAAGALPPSFVTAGEVEPRRHVDMQAAAQAWVDSSISKTINVPSDYPFEAFKDIYRYAFEKGLKGCTTFRFNPAHFQGVLVRNEDLAAATYRFELADGGVIEARGNEEIEYEGEVHTAANLYDALKEGYYGRF